MFVAGDGPEVICSMR